LCGNKENTSGAASAANSAPPVRITMNTTIARRAMRPEAAASVAVLTPTTTSASTSGTTVICSAFNHSLPTGCTALATCSATD
jgi:hypothetical protein